MGSAPNGPQDRNDAALKSALRPLCDRSDARGLRHLAAHAGLLAATGMLVLASRGTPWLLPALVAQGTLLVFLFAPLHETIHRTAFRSRALNDAVARVCGFLLLLPAGYFRAFHLQHHRFTQDPARDPELSRAPLRSRLSYLLRVSGLPYWRERLTTTLQHASGRVGEDFVPPRQRPSVIREARAHLGAYALLAAGSLLLGSDLLLFLWVFPALLGQPLLRLYLLAEHSGCPAVDDMLANSRTTLTNAAVRFLCWNMNLHSAHHAYPAVPFHALPAADRVLEPYIAERSPGYWRVQRELWRRLPWTTAPNPL